MPDVSLNGIEFQIKGSTGNASSSIDSLVGKLNALKAALENAGNVKTLANGLKGLQKAMEGISKADVSGTTSALRALGKTAQDLQGLANMSKDLASFARAMVKLSEDPTKLHELAAALNIVGSVDLTNLVAASDALRAFADAMRAINSGGGSRETEAQATAWSRLGNAINGIVNGGAKGFMRLLAFPFTRAAKDIGGYAKSIWGVVSGFKRIVGYRLIRSIIREITQAFSEGIENLYGWSKAMGGATISGKNFAQTMDGLATSSLYFKNSIGAMVAPIISTLAPAIDYIIDKIVALINVINQLFALLGGATSWNKAIRKATEFEDAAGGAGGAAKEALRYLAPFDELNRLPDDNKGGGGGGGTDYSGMFEEQTEFLEGLKDFADSIRAAIDAGDWEGLGTLLGDKVNELIEKIDFESLGTSLGEKINALFTTRYWTLKEINFQTIGAKIAEFFNSALGSIDFNTIGRTFAQKFTLLPDMIIGFLGEADWALIGKSVGDYIRGVFSEGAEWLSGINWREVGTNIVNGIKDFFLGADVPSLVDAISNFLITAFDAAADLLIGAIDTIFTKEFWEEITDAIVENAPNMMSENPIYTLLFGITGKQVEEALDPLLSNAGTLIGGWLSDLPTNFANAGIKAINALFEPIATGINNFIDEHPDIAAFFGLHKIPIELIPELPEEELHEGYNKAKEAIEAAANQDPPKVPVSAIPDPDPNGPVFSVEDLLGGKSSITIPVFAAFSGTGLTPADFLGGKDSVDLPVQPKLGLEGTMEFTRSMLGGKDAIEIPVKPKPSGSGSGGNGDGNAFLMELMGGREYIDLPVKPKMQNDITGLFDGDPIEVPIKAKNDVNIPAVADFRDWSVYGTKNSETVKSFTTWDSTANWKDWKVYGSKSNSNVNSFTTWNSTANWNKQTIGKSWGGTTWSSTANFTKYTIKPGLQADDGSLKVNGTFNITRLTGKTNISNDIDKAVGGLYNSSGWHPIQNFAGGGSPFGGQIFRARENGNPELVGTLRGSTAVMNNDQIVASVSSGVARAIAGIRFQMTGLSASAPAMEESANEDTMYRAFRRALDETDFGKDISIDGEPIYRSVVRRNRQNTRATGVNQLAMA